MIVVTNWKKMVDSTTWLLGIVANYIVKYERKRMDQSVYLFIMVSIGDANLAGRIVLFLPLPPYKLLLTLEVMGSFLWCDL